ncbi:MAG: nicotinate-nucleotide--dimethylbenzimidazole phosphoribosyltransferase [Cetobacterium sp.]|uniref:nicotinate-nucleotide--dimethylbenzimidazole phosphoribosyltransferase n=1 Tax=unclassified Cetobacterium TaxID=2630983 RepID=UPI00163CF194|nr:nicotinate-nucleotide--dimethylbenzimidazole phosphoribosyltransferase [Cetobacterium sp. 2A]MBC2855841.1 nicotinate-nucleotide--dimethylbenzimidazole phosphoribosyltransferase [Cetobacterium sp. 2A]
MNNLKRSLKAIDEIDINAGKRCKDILDGKMKPQDSLGILEETAIKISEITGDELKKINKGCHLIASADNGIVEEGVSSCPVEYTKIVSETMLNKMAAIGILCKNLDIDLKLVDIGIKEDIPRDYENLYSRKVRNGTRNFFVEPAMTMDECVKAINHGIELVEELSGEYDFFSNGEMGIGNTTTSSAILYALTRDDLDKVVGRGAGLSDKGLEKKKNVIESSCKRYDLFEKSPLEILRHVGGLDIACMVGFYIGAAKMKKPMLIDGFISAVAALVSTKIEPKTKGYMIATHMSEEPGMKLVMKELKLNPFLNMKMRLGEGTGAVLVYPMMKLAMEIPRNMKTQEEVYKIFN